jgi:hypothetical protein
LFRDTSWSIIAEELFALGQEKGVVVMPYQNRRFDGDYLAMKQVVEQGCPKANNSSACSNVSQNGFSTITDLPAKMACLAKS